MTEYMITTTDNPFDPFTQFKDWFGFDAALGYHTPSYLARIVKTSDELSELDQHLAIEQGIDEIIAEHAGGLFVKVGPKEDKGS